MVHTRAVGGPDDIDSDVDKLYNKMSVQLVPGLGETLAGNTPGAPLTAQLARRAATPAVQYNFPGLSVGRGFPNMFPNIAAGLGMGNMSNGPNTQIPSDVAITVERYPSKPTKSVLDLSMRHTDSVQLPLIFRSDSNMEDLRGRSGAGLFESVALQQSRLKSVDYSVDPITNRREGRDKLLARVYEVCKTLE